MQGSRFVVVYIPLGLPHLGCQLLQLLALLADILDLVQLLKSRSAQLKTVISSTQNPCAKLVLHLQKTITKDK
jgi:hypothetical protein